MKRFSYQDIVFLKISFHSFIIKIKNQLQIIYIIRKYGVLNKGLKTTNTFEFINSVNYLETKYSVIFIPNLVIFVFTFSKFIKIKK